MHPMLSSDSAQAATRPANPVTWSPFDHSGSRAITAHRELLIPEPYTSQSQSRLLSRIENLLTADRRKDESMALLSHELRSPLASIQNAIAVLRIRSTDDSLQERMHVLIERQIRQIALLTSSLGPMAGPGLENLPLQRERIDLCTMLSRAAETVTPEFAQRHHQLSIDLPLSNIWIIADAGRLEQVFVNLLSNASKYSDVGGRITMSTHIRDAHAVVQIRDSGIGIAADSMPHIFDLFVRADTTAVRTRSGRGIGLALVRSILDSHHGTVSAASGGIGQGSEFTVRLELAN
jgi:two-component system, sensor histidine kinase